MRNKKPWFRKIWKDHAYGNPQTDTRENKAAESGSENIISGTGNGSPKAASGVPNAAQQLFENEAAEAHKKTPNAAQRLYAEESTHDEKKSKPASRRKYVIAAAMSIAVLLLAAIPATYSYLTASSETVINTFAGGAISLTLDEADVDTDGNPLEDEPRVQENSYKVVPGATLYKDPTVTVLSGSEVCYVYLYVENPLDEDYFTLDYSSDWKVVATTGTKTLYIYKTTVDASDGDVELTPVFTTITVSDELTDEQIKAMGEVQIIVQAYAVQAQGVDSADSVQMAADYFETEFGFKWTDVDTAVEIDGLITADAEDSEETDGSEETDDSDTSSDTEDEESSADKADATDSSSSSETSDDTDTSDMETNSTDTSAEESDSTSSEESSSDEGASESSESSGSDVSTESTDSSGDATALNITP